jgi:hypothetical protein
VSCASQGILCSRLRLCRRLFLRLLHECPHLANLACHDDPVLRSGIVCDNLVSDRLAPLGALTCRQNLVWNFGLALFSEGLGLSIVVVLVIVLLHID